jgi:autotransporter translocation and assembly factor TamB
MDLTFDLDVPPDFSVKNMPMRGSVVLKDLWVDRRHSPKVDARLDGSVQVEGTVAAPVVRGRVEVRRAEIAPDVGVRDVAEVKDPEDVVFVAPELLVLPAEERGRLRPVAPVSALVLALEVKLPFRSVHLGNELMDLWVSGDLTLGAKGGGLSIEGTVTVDEGRVALYGKEFVVGEESRVTFDGSVPVNPRLALQASYGISNVDLSPIDLAADADSRLTVTVTGSAAAPKVEITSTPAMAEADIVSILLFDAPSRQPDLGQGTANLFVGAALGGLTKALQKDLPVDVLKVEGGEQGLVDARIQVGKRLTRDLMVVYEANLGAEVDENANTLRVQYEFTRHLQLETHFGDKGEGGVDLVLRWRW